MAVQIIDWPSGVPQCILSDSPQGGLKDTRRSFDADIGPPIERPATSWVGEVYAIELAPMSADDFAAFQAWYIDDLAHGVNAFVMPHPVTRVDGVWKIVKADPPFQVRKTGRIPTGSDARRVSVSMSIMSMPLAVPE